MSWLLKQAEDILNRVDQHTNAALHSHTSKQNLRSNEVEFTSDIPSYIPSRPIDTSIVNSIPSTRTNITPQRRIKKTDDTDLINYLNSSTPINQNETKKVSRSNTKTRTSSSSSTTIDEPFDRNKSSPIQNFSSREVSSEHELIASLHAQLDRLTSEKNQLENDLQISKRQQIQYQHQIGESDALLRDLRLRESDSQQILSAKDAQISLLRQRSNEIEQTLQIKTTQYDQLQNEYSHLSSSLTSSSSDFLQSRIQQLEQEFERILYENQRLTNENEQLKQNEKHLHEEHFQFYEQQQQIKQTKNTIQQLEQELNDYKLKAQRILQTKEKLIEKLKEIIQYRTSTPTSFTDQHDINTNDDSTLFEITQIGNSSSNINVIEYEELKSEHELFKQELQSRELKIHNLKNEIHENESLIQQIEEQYQEQIRQLNEQFKDKTSRLILTEQDCRKYKEELIILREDLNKHKQIYQTQLTEREREIQGLRLQLTAKTINHVNDEELEKRLQTLTESLIYKQTIIENLQTEKSSLTMQLERLEKRLDDYEIITEAKMKTSLPTTISIDDQEQYENLRYRMPLLRETPYDVDLTKKVKRAANQLDQLGIRFTIFLRHYPAVRLAVLIYAIVLHLWTFFLLFTHTPDIHSHTNSMN